MRIKNILLSALVAAGCLFGAAACKSNSGSSDTNSGSVSNADIAGNVGDVAPKTGDLIAEIEINGFGTIRAVLFPDAAPTGVENFKLLADAGFYDGLTIHRVVSDFMFQGGSLNGDGTGGDALVNDGSFGIETANNMRHFYGALCYANAAGTNTTQFYIVNNNEPTDISAINLDDLEFLVSQFRLAAASAEYNDPDSLAYLNNQAEYYATIVEWLKNATDDIKSKYKEVGGTPTLDGNYTVFGQVYDGFDVIESVSAVKVEDNGMGEVSKPVQEITIASVKVYEYTEG
ncbi:MAG: peptidylprolyl isomerase [Oscillospiraceae bacterium]|nr:peptidylprolyl isomerase [Oscillospiraceae bacterium]